MSKVVLQPAANKQAKIHYENTVIKPVKISRIKNLLNNNILSKVEKLYLNGEVFIWGVTNGSTGTNENKWRGLSNGDIVLFSQRGGIFSTAKVTMIFKNYDLAKELLGVDDNGNAWENIYFIKDIKELEIPYSKLNPVLGYKSNFVIQGFMVLDQEKSERLIYNFNL